MTISAILVLVCIMALVSTVAGVIFVGVDLFDNREFLKNIPAVVQVWYTMIVVTLWLAYSALEQAAKVIAATSGT